MIEVSKSKNEIIVRRNTIFMFIDVLVVCMALTGIFILYSLLPFGEDYTFADVFGIIFVCVWILIVLGMGVYGFVTTNKRVTINMDGILCESMFGKKHIKWSDVNDFGLSYCSKTKGNGNVYYLYFSEHECAVKNAFSKKLKGGMIKTFVIGNDYRDAKSQIIPFCKKKTPVKPFVAKDVYHFI